MFALQAVRSLLIGFVASADEKVNEGVDTKEGRSRALYGMNPFALFWLERKEGRGREGQLMFLLRTLISQNRCRRG